MLCNAIETARFWCASTPQKVWLIEQCLHADASSIERYNAFLDDGNMITLRYLGVPGCYIPAHTANNMAEIRLSWRYGLSSCVHTLLHELVHAEQDREGRLLTHKGTHEPSAEAARAQYMGCEKEAGFGAIAASWRLLKAGYPHAWRGVLASTEWRRIALYYAEHENISDNEWHESPAYHYYQKRSERLFSEAA